MCASKKPVNRTEYNDVKDNDKDVDSKMPITVNNKFWHFTIETFCSQYDFKLDLY